MSSGNHGLFASFNLRIDFTSGVDFRNPRVANHVPRPLVPKIGQNKGGFSKSCLRSYKRGGKVLHRPTALRRVVWPSRASKFTTLAHMTSAIVALCPQPAVISQRKQEIACSSPPDLRGHQWLASVASKLTYCFLNRLVIFQLPAHPLGMTKVSPALNSCFLPARSVVIRWPRRTRQNSSCG